MIATVCGAGPARRFNGQFSLSWLRSYYWHLMPVGLQLNVINSAKISTLKPDLPGDEENI